MRIGVTGGAGFIGTNLVRLLLGKGHTVIVLDDLSTGLAENLRGLDLTLMESSITDSQAIKSFSKEVDFVFHLAARGSVPRSIEYPRATFEANTLGTFNVLEAARERGIPLVFSSSSSVYGDNIVLPKNEDQRSSPISPYAASKASAEAFTYAYAKSYNLSFWTIRFFNVFGPFQRPNHEYAAVIPKWIWSALHKKDLVVQGDGETSRDFTYVDTVTSILYAILEQRPSRNLPVNLAFGRSITLNSVISQLRDFFPELTTRYEDFRPGDIRNSMNDPKELYNLVSNFDDVPFQIGLKKTVSWLKEMFDNETTTRRKE